MMDAPRTIAVLGLGLMGGSLARALRASSRPPRVVAWTPDGGDPERALAEGVIDGATADATDAVHGADLVVLAAPVGASVALVARIATALHANTVLTDVCGVKAPVLRAAQLAGCEDRYAGSHPMCGSHAAGWSAARADLYRGARVHIVPSTVAITTRRVEAFWEGLGAVTARIDAASHDALMARVSHLPQVLASALAASLAGSNVERGALGPGGVGMTRLAASSTSLWTDLLMHNRPAVGDALRALQAELDRVERALADGDAQQLADVLARGRIWTEGRAG